MVPGLETAIGRAQMIEGESSRISGDNAEARVIVTGEIKSAALTFHLVREYGLWMISELPAVPSA